MDYLTPSVPLLENPVGLDAAIQKIQIELRKLEWLSSLAFGRAFRQQGTEKAKGNRTITSFFPIVYLQNNEAINCMMNDNLKAYSFFYAHDPASVNYAPGKQNYYVQTISLIVWGNLKKIDSSKDFRYTEHLKEDVLKVLGKFYEVQVSRIYQNYENVFINFTILDSYREFLKFPYTGFRIDFELSYKDKGC